MDETYEQIGIPDGWDIVMKPAYNRFPDFNKIMPQPENIFNGNLGDVERELCRVEGRPNWYDWNITNWGTKWNSYSCEKINDNTVIFETAWNSVVDLINKISKDFSDVEIIYTYADENTEYNCGRIIFKNGIIDTHIPPSKTKEAYDLSFELRPEYKDNYIFKDNNYYDKDED